MPAPASGLPSTSSDLALAPEVLLGSLFQVQTSSMLFPWWGWWDRGVLGTVAAALVDRQTCVCILCCHRLCLAGPRCLNKPHCPCWSSGPHKTLQPAGWLYVVDEFVCVGAQSSSETRDLHNIKTLYVGKRTRVLSQS